jgi:excinuclease ABC subunit C
MTNEEYKILHPTLPDEPGVYRFIGEEEVILYVGKAKNLKKRISNYFGNSSNQMAKTKIMVRSALKLEFTIVESEQDALLLESTFIKKHQPRYNVMLKDGKTYAYICIKNEKYPRVLFTRKIIRDGSVYFGPYTSKTRANILYELIKKLFPLRTCNLNLTKENITKGKFKVCLEYHIKNCLGPCQGLEDEEDYLKKISQIKNILKGSFSEVKSYLKNEMGYYAEKLEFEKAQTIKQKLSAFEDYQSKSTVVSNTIKDVDVFSIGEDDKMAYINYLKVINGAIINTYSIELIKNLDEDLEMILSYSVAYLREKFDSIAPEVIVPIKITLEDKSIATIIPTRGDKKKLLELSEKNIQYQILQKKKEQISHVKKITPAERILKTLQSDLNMNVVPFHIECFDNSNIMGTNPVSSCVVFKNAKPSKRDYRQYKIKTVEGPNDFASMQEVVGRRYRRLLEENSPLPDLIIIDGGKGQLSAAVDTLKELGLYGKITIVGIAKRLEEIYFPEDSVPLYINKKSESLKLIQQARNEAHRFAITFHRNQRSKNFLVTELSGIEGVGEVTVKKLLTHFKSVTRTRKATIGELKEVIGLSIAEKVYRYFEENNSTETPLNDENND